MVCGEWLRGRFSIVFTRKTVMLRAKRSGTVAEGRSNIFEAATSYFSNLKFRPSGYSRLPSVSIPLFAKFDGTVLAGHPLSTALNSSPCNRIGFWPFSGYAESPSCDRLQSTVLS